MKTLQKEERGKARIIPEGKWVEHYKKLWCVSEQLGDEEDENFWLIIWWMSLWRLN